MLPGNRMLTIEQAASIRKISRPFAKDHLK